MKSLNSFLVRAAPALVWLALAAIGAAAERTSANAAPSAYGIVSLSPAFLPQTGYSGDLTLLSSLPQNLARSRALPSPIVSVTINPSGQLQPYRLRAGDEVTVAVFQQPKLGTVKQRIDASGNLVLAFVAEAVHLAGLSVAEAEAVIAQTYRSKGAATDPRVNLQIDDYRPVRVIGPGEVIIPSFSR
jgi:hypothetical protein